MVPPKSARRLARTSKNSKVFLGTFGGVLVLIALSLWKTPQLLDRLDMDHRQTLRVPISPYRYKLRFPTKHQRKVQEKRHRHSKQKRKAISSVGEAVSSLGRWKNEHNLVHVIHTRFREQEDTLKHLNHARMELFRVFTAPSIRQQSNHDFAWIIWTDDQPSQTFLELMKEALVNMHNVIILGAQARSNSNIRHLNGLSVQQATNALLMGNIDFLTDLVTASQSRILLETMLDADDALSKNFVESLQTQVTGTVGNSTNLQQVEIYCPERHVEWRYFQPTTNYLHHHPAGGHLMQFHNPNYCIGSGLSIAYHLHAKGEHMQNIPNASMIHELVKPCEHHCHHKHAHTDKSSLEDPENAEHHHERRMTRCDGKGSQVMDYVKESSEDEHLTMCPLGAVLCVADTHSYSLGGPTFMLPQERITCYTADKQESEVDLTVKPLDYTLGSSAQSGIELQVDSRDYLLSAVYLKSNDGGSLYSWDGDEDGEFRAGGARQGIFRTPRFRPIQHVDICVVPYSKVCDSAKQDPEAASPLDGAKKEDVPTEQAKDDSSTSVTLVVHPPKVLGKDMGPQVCRRPLQLLNENTLAPFRNYHQTGVLLAHTPTSAGMDAVLPSSVKKWSNSTTNCSMAVDVFESKTSQEHAWVILQHDFGVEWEDVSELRASFEANMEGILTDAVQRHCQHMPSCDTKSQRRIKELLKRYRQRRKLQ